MSNEDRSDLAWRRPGWAGKVLREGLVAGSVGYVRASGAGRVLVVRDGGLVGIVSASDVTGWALRVRELGAPATARSPGR